MQIARWGNSLAVRLPARLVRDLGLREGDEVELTPTARPDALALARAPDAAQILAALRPLRGRLPAADRLSRDDAHDRLARDDAHDPRA